MVPLNATAAGAARRGGHGRIIKQLEEVTEDKLVGLVAVVAALEVLNG